MSSEGTGARPKRAFAGRGGIAGRNSNLSGYLFILPLLVLFAVFLLYSFYFLLKTSTSFVTISFRNPRFVGLNNFRIILHDPEFFLALLNSFILSFSNIFFGLSIGFVLAVFLSFALPARRFFNALFFVPSMLPIAFIAVVFGSMLEYHSGIVNVTIRALGLSFLNQHWLSDSRLAMGTVSSMSVYLIGVPIMYYTADLSTLNTSIFEAAIIDGAKLRQIIFLIVHPMLASTHKTIALTLLLVGFREMERVYLMTDSGPGGATDIIGTYIYRNTRFAGSNLGLVSAAAVIVLAIAFTIAFIQPGFNRRSARR